VDGPKGSGDAKPADAAYRKPLTSLDRAWGDEEPAPAGTPAPTKALTIKGGTPAVLPKQAPAAPPNDAGPAAVEAGALDRETMPHGVPRASDSKPGAAAPVGAGASVKPLPPPTPPRRAATLMGGTPSREPQRGGPAGTTQPGVGKGEASAAHASKAPPVQVPSPAVQPAAQPARSRPPAAPSKTDGAARAKPIIDEDPPATLADELRRHAAHIKSADAIGAARAFVELGIVEERVNQDRVAARKAYELARALSRTMEAALGRVRRLYDGKSELEQVLRAVDDEISIASSEAEKGDLCAERARVLEALGRLPDARASYADALRLVPGHAASLHGLEAVLRRELAKSADRTLAQDLAAHLERVGAATSPQEGKSDGDARLTAWVNVERAGVLDGAILKEAGGAQAALERAVAFDAPPGPVRSGLARHLVRHDRIKELAASLSVEAESEQDADRASRLLYSAARLILDRLDMPAEAAHVLARALGRAPEGTATARRIHNELIRLLEQTGEYESSAQVRQKRLPLITDSDAIAHEHVRLSEIFDQLGRADQSAYHAERALEIHPTDASTRERLDRALQRLGRHDERVRSWTAEANASRPVAVRVDALLRASDIAERHLKRREDALAHLRVAWAIDPGNARVFDALSALLAPPTREVEADVRGVRARLDLYTQAAHAAVDPHRKVGLLEKLVSIWEDELGQPARALEEIDKILAIEPKRRSAVLALQRNAERASDAKQLARGLAAEADLTDDPALQRTLLLKAADVTDGRLGDRDRALALVDRALAIDPKHEAPHRARYRLLDKASRYAEAKKALVALVTQERDDDKRFGLWVEIALLDEHKLKKPYDAVDAYSQAAKVKPRHPLPPREIVRLLRAANDPAKLVEAILRLAGTAADQDEYARLLFQAAEVQEHLLRDDDAALKCLAQADGLPDAEADTARLESMERIFVRRGDRAQLAPLYTRWLERQPPPQLDHELRVALASVLAEDDPAQACGLLEGLLTVVPTHVPALRLLEQIHRKRGELQQLGAVLRTQADVFQSKAARCGALWELVSLEEQVGQGATLDALVRIVADAPADTAALDAIVRIASKLTAGVNVPHPGVLATRARLVPAISARKELERDPIARALYQLEEAVLVEGQAPDDLNALRVALAGYQGALATLPDSLLAARGLERLSERLGDRKNLVAAHLALAELVHFSRPRAGHLVRAALILVEDPKSQGEALALFEDALVADPDCEPAAQNLARMLANDVPRLTDRLGTALQEATMNQQIMLLGIEIARALLRQREAGGQVAAIDASAGIEAMRKVLDVMPGDVTSLLLMAKLLIGQRVWAEARDTLQRVVDVATDAESRLSALFMLADVHETGLADPGQARAQLQAILIIDDKNRRALERLLQLAVAQGDRTLIIHTLGRLADTAPDAAARVEVDLRLADACRDANDANGRVRALADAIVSLPADTRAWTALARLYRVDAAEGAASYAAALQVVLDAASARRIPLDPRWLTTLGLLEVTILVRPTAGIGHLQQAATLPGAPTEARVALGRGLEAAGRNAEAAQVLRDVLVNDADTFARLGELGVALAALEAALAKDGRSEERIAVEEVRAALGEVKPDRVQRLRSRRLAEGVPYPQTVTGEDMGRLLVAEARSEMINVAVAIAPVAAKILRFDLGGLGVTSRDRINPRDMHPLRFLAERIAAALGIEQFELYLSQTWQGAARVYPGDPPIIVGPTSFIELPEPEQAFAFGRLFTRMALGLTWLDELPVDAADGLLLASVRAVEPSFGSGELTPARDSMAQSFVAAVQRAIGRRQKKLLEDIAPSATTQYDPRTFSIGVRRSEYRIAYVLSGDLVSAIDYLRRFDREIARSGEEPRVLLQHPVTNEMLRYALTADSYAERRRVGAIWSGV
jgi:tetratricopeptide (TPR) repeat protein